LLATILQERKEKSEAFSFLFPKGHGMLLALGKMLHGGFCITSTKPFLTLHNSALGLFGAISFFVGWNRITEYTHSRSKCYILMLL